MNTAKRAQFTPGPWEVTGPNTCEVITSNTGTYKPIRTIAKVNGYWDGEVLANMHLIAAAPAMYAIIKDMREAFYVKGTRKALLAVMERSRDVIAQAEGR